jgi:hypothetical protein
MILHKISIGGIIFGSFRNSSRFSSMAMTTRSEQASAVTCAQAREFKFNDFEAWLTTGGDDRSLILKSSGANKVCVVQSICISGSLESVHPNVLIHKHYLFVTYSTVPHHASPYCQR